MLDWEGAVTGKPLMLMLVCPSFLRTGGSSPGDVGRLESKPL